MTKNSNEAPDKDSGDVKKFNDVEFTDGQKVYDKEDNHQGCQHDRMWMESLRWKLLRSHLLLTCKTRLSRFLCCLGFDLAKHAHYVS
mmetsp:Transcript_13271/g.30893  ORF Transcript_13271/g.30893 Transcript_13271/m.30893 type:complete len:87 (-) Transcript_13271:244-504(-)